MELARQLALAAVDWDVPTASWIPLVAAHAAAAEVLGEDNPAIFQSGRGLHPHLPQQPVPALRPGYGSA